MFAKVERQRTLNAVTAADTVAPNVNQYAHRLTHSACDQLEQRH
jgi:hypothetical protein